MNKEDPSFEEDTVWKEVFCVQVSESMRKKLLAEELKMRSKQPRPWTEIKYRKYANFGRNRNKTI